MLWLYLAMLLISAFSVFLNGHNAMWSYGWRRYRALTVDLTMMMLALVSCAIWLYAIAMVGQ